MKLGRIGVSLHSDLPEHVRWIVEAEGVPAGKSYGEYQVYELPLYRIEEIQRIMQHEVGAVFG